jgi:hypothetical protein
MPIARSRRAVTIAVAIGLGQSFSFPASAQGGFFDFLFGFQPQAPAAKPYEPHLRRVHHAHWRVFPDFGWRTDRRVENHAHSKAQRTLRLARLTDHPDHPVRPQKPVDLMEDESLRKGDAVMTPAGIRIFIGHSGDHHTPNDFKEPSEVKGLSKRQRKVTALGDSHGASIKG